MNKYELVIEDPYELLSKLDDDKDVKIVANERTILPNVVLYDLSLDVAGPDEDKVFARNELYRQNIRRGNTFIQILKKQGDKTLIEGTRIVRRGMRKFFDLQKEYALYGMGKISRLDGKYGNKAVQDEHKQFYQMIFGDVQEAFKQGLKVKVYSLVKANGENAQVTFVQSLNMWLVASKNVSILANKREDLKTYNGQRFTYAKLIAECWFDTLDEMEKKYGQQKVESLKQDLLNRTIVGEYCGNQNCQHIVHYDRVTIYWFGIVSHNSNDTCMEVLTGLQFFKAYGLDVVNHIELGEFSESKQLFRVLAEECDKTATSPLSVSNEGCVLYFELQGNQKRVLSMCKLKTLEYRFYRKLREKLRSFYIDSKIRTKDLMIKYEREIKELAGDNIHHLPHKLDYYLDIADYAFEFADKNDNQDAQRIVLESYVTFLTVVKYCMTQRYSVKMKCFQKSEIDRAYKEMNETRELSQSQKQRVLIVLIPIGVPGLGKSTTLEYLSNHISVSYDDVEVSTISSDIIRAELMAKELKKDPKLSRSEQFDKTRQSGPKEYDARIRLQIQSFLKRNSSSVLLLILDKNHTPKTVREQQKFLRKQYEGPDLAVKTVVLAPQTTPYENGELRLPLSLHLMMTCINRVQSRKEHNTLIGNGEESLKVVTSFLNSFRDENIDKFDSLVIHVPYVEESNKNNKQYGVVCEEDFAAMFNNPNQSTYEDFLESLRMNAPSLQNIDEVKLKALIENLATKMFEELQVGINPKSIKVNGKDKKVQFDTVKIAAPEYYGIFFLGNNIWDKLDTWVYNCLVKAELYFKEIGNFVDDFDDFIQQKDNPGGYKRIVKPHVTVLYIGNNKIEDYQNTEAYKQFKTGQKYNVILEGIIACRDHIITAVISLKELPIIQNKHPHVTLYTSKMQAKDSNLLMQALNEKISHTESIYKFQFNYRNNYVEAIYIKAKEPMILEGVTQMHYQ